MTEEEKLTEEEYKFAEEVIKPIYRKAIQNNNSFAKYGINCYLAGLKAGKDTNVSIKWHKVADGDLPKKFDEPYLCYVNGHFEVGYFMAYKEQPWHFDEYYLDNEDVIAWCEIPQFKE